MSGNNQSRAATVSRSPVTYFFTGVFTICGVALLIMAGLDIASDNRHGIAMGMLIIGIVFTCVAVALLLLIFSGSRMRKQQNQDNVQGEQQGSSRDSTPVNSRLSSAPPPYSSTSIHNGSPASSASSASATLTGEATVCGTLRVQMYPGPHTTVQSNPQTGSLEQVLVQPERLTRAAYHQNQVDLPNALPGSMSRHTPERDSDMSSTAYRMVTPPLATSSFVVDDSSRDSQSLALSGHGSLGLIHVTVTRPTV